MLCICQFILLFVMSMYIYSKKWLDLNSTYCRLNFVDEWGSALWNCTFFFPVRTIEAGVAMEKKSHSLYTEHTHKDTALKLHEVSHEQKNTVKGEWKYVRRGDGRACNAISSCAPITLHDLWNTLCSHGETSISTTASLCVNLIYIFDFPFT